jgi:hypothetical protein
LSVCLVIRGAGPEREKIALRSNIYGIYFYNPDYSPREDEGILFSVTPEVFNMLFV